MAEPGVTFTVVNASPLIALRQLDRLALLHDLLGTVFIPPAVYREVFHSTTSPLWIEQRTLTQSVSPLFLAPRLGAGEREAISLAVELDNCLVVLDDLAARRAAAALGLAVAGTVGLLIQVRQRGLLTALKPALDTLLSFDFRISRQLYLSALHAADET